MSFRESTQSIILMGHNGWLDQETAKQFLENNARSRDFIEKYWTEDTIARKMDKCAALLDLDWQDAYLQNFANPNPPEPKRPWWRFW